MKINSIGQVFMRLKLTIFILTGLLLRLSAADGYGQTVTLREQHVSLPEVFEMIRKQTGYTVFYRSADVLNAKPIRIEVVDVPLEDALHEVLKGLDLTFTMDERTIVIKEQQNERSFIRQLLRGEQKASESQQISAQGRVVDERGEPLSGATIRVSGSSRAVLSDSNGHFGFSALPEGTVLVITFIGYQEQQRSATAQMGVIQMVPKDGKLDEISVISTGYQQIEKSQMTGAASVIGTTSYQQRTAVTGNFLENLEGKVPGLVYNAQSGALTIRGVSTFDAVKEPLIVLDGFPTEIDLRTINPDDIVSVSVLRDAAAASIYGARASNGVIVVETRRGSKGKPVFHFQGTYATQRKPDFGYLRFAPASEFVQLQKEQFIKGNLGYEIYAWGFGKMNPVEEIMFGLSELEVANPLYTPEQADQMLAVLGSYDNLREYERLFYQSRQATNLQLDVSGGGEYNTYVLGLNMVHEQPVERRSENTQIFLNVANTYTLSDRFHLDFKGTYAHTEEVRGKHVPYYDFFPYERLADERGVALPVSVDPARVGLGRVITDEKNERLMSLGLYDMLYYPYRELTSNTATNKGEKMRVQARLNVRLTKWLNADMGGNYELQHILLDELSKEDAYEIRALINTMAVPDPVTGQAMFPHLPQGDILTRTSQRLSNYTLRGQLNIAHTFGTNIHEVSGILGAERKRTVAPSFKTSYFGYDGESLLNKPVNLTTLNTISGPAFTDVGYGSYFKSTNYFAEQEADRRFVSFYGQGTYIFDAKYVATGSFRIDQSNLFGVDPKYKYKPLWSVGANWMVGKEEFLADWDGLDDLQLRAATGFNGNVPSSLNAAFLILQSGLNTFLESPLAYNDVLSPENQSLRWETSRHDNIGLDFALLGNRLSGSLDWYQKETTDVFGRFDADPTTGFNDYFANTSSIRNSGLELLLNSQNLVSGNFQWRTQLTASFNRNKVLAVKETEYNDSQLITSGVNLVAGRPMGALYSYHYGGLNRFGQPYVLDREGNPRVLSLFGTIVDVTMDDLIYSGTTIPKHVVGLNNQFRLGPFDLSFLLMYYGGHVMRVEQPNPNNIGFYSNNPIKGSSNFWRKPGDEAYTIIPGFPAGDGLDEGYFQSFALYGYTYAAQFVRKADYLRLRDVVLTYRAGGRAISAWGLKDLQIRLQVQNPYRYTFSGNDIDPEAIDPLNGGRMLEQQSFYSLTLSTRF